MCINCDNDGIGRRDFMKFGAAGAVALGLGGGRPVGARGRWPRRLSLSPGSARCSSNRAMSAL